MNSETLRRTIFCLDGLRYSFAMTEVSANRLTGTLDAVARQQEQSVHSEQAVASALLDAWTIVDMCHRVRELIQQLPGLSQRTPRVQVFLRATSPVEQLRHYVQHLRGEIAKAPSLASPLWGTLSWVPSHDQITCYTMFTGNIIPGVASQTCTYDTYQHSFAHRLVLIAEDITIELPSVVERLTELRTFVLDWIDKHPRFKRAEGKTLIWKFQVKKAEQSIQPTEASRLGELQFVRRRRLASAAD